MRSKEDCFRSEEKELTRGEQLRRALVYERKNGWDRLDAEEGAALEKALVRALPDAQSVLHGQIDATLAVHLGPNLLGVGVQFI